MRRRPAGTAGAAQHSGGHCSFWTSLLSNPPPGGPHPVRCCPPLVTVGSWQPSRAKVTRAQGNIFTSGNLLLCRHHTDVLCSRPPLPSLPLHLGRHTPAPAALGRPEPVPVPWRRFVTEESIRTFPSWLLRASTSCLQRTTRRRGGGGGGLNQNSVPLPPALQASCRAKQ